MTPEIVARIKMDLEKKWSPEQISGRLRLEKKYISHERIYQHIWDDKKAGGTLYKNLRHAHSTARELVPPSQLPHRCQGVEQHGVDQFAQINQY
jgi:IS30 family transposase